MQEVSRGKIKIRRFYGVLSEDSNRCIIGKRVEKPVKSSILAKKIART